MKTFIMTVLIVCAVVIAAAIVYLDWPKKSAAPAPVAEAAPANQAVESEPTEPASAPQPQPVVAQPASAPQEATVSPAATAPADSVSPVHKLVSALLNAKSAAEKQAAFDELRKNGELDAAIADLKQQAAENPNDPKIPTTIGEAELNQIRAIAENGGPTANRDQMGILAMQADQEFDAALQIDPKNWEAQFVKASMMYYWPANPQTDNQVVQNLTSLIDQQETMAANPNFAQTYVVLGNEYQKIGQADKAMATWQLGAQEYPSDSALQKKIAGGQ